MTTPKQILFEKCADVGFEWQGDVPVSEFERLYAHLNPTAQQNAPTLAVSIHLHQKDGTVWLTTTIKGTLWLDCHRCLEPMSETVDDQYVIAIVRHEQELPALELIEAEYVFWEEVAHDGRLLPVLDMIEDELILSLPLANHHEDCDLLVETVGEIVEEPKENPFAILAQLKS